MKPIRKIVDCPKCNEGDYRYVGINVCGLCECKFYVKGGHVILHPDSRPFTCSSAKGKSDE
jgi:hypothetical protein